MNKSKKIFIIIILVIVLFLSFCVFKQLKKEEPNFCGLSQDFCSEFQELIPHYLIYDAIIDNKPIEFIRLGSDVGAFYIFPKILLDKSDVLMSYGILNSYRFESEFAYLSKKPAFGFDCSSKPNTIRNTDLFTFEPDCIGTDKFIIQEKHPDAKMHMFSDKIKQLGIADKKIYIKMDIAGAEFEPEIFDDILTQTEKITGISLVIHLDEISQIQPAINLLTKLEKDFVLVMRQTHFLHGSKLTPKNTTGLFTQGMSLAYVNKNLVDSYHIKLNQDTSNIEWEGSKNNIEYSDIFIHRYLPYIIKKHFLG